MDPSSSTADASCSFDAMNVGYDRVFQSTRLSIGLVAPIEAYPNKLAPSMVDHLARVRLAEELGYKAVWLRDVPFNVPAFGDAGQLFDPFVYLGFLAARTSSIALGVASIILPLRHPAHVAKAAASVDMLSGGRLLLGVASGDRPEEYPALNVDYAERGNRFRASVEYLRNMNTNFPSFSNQFGSLTGAIDMLPKSDSKVLPLLVTGGAQQTPEWIAGHADGWMIYPRDVDSQVQIVRAWRERVQLQGRTPKPIMQPLYIDLLEDASAPAQPIHLGLRCGVRALRSYLLSLKTAGVNHVALNLRFNEADIETTLKRLAQELFSEFH